jgi:hypothetical protein
MKIQPSPPKAVKNDFILACMVGVSSQKGRVGFLAMDVQKKSTRSKTKVQNES